jgi:iron-sulfur cluster repair protein YtfE (RIC family)
MTVHTEGFRRSHEQLLERTSELAKLAAEAPELSIGERSARVSALLDLMRTKVEPHTRLDERLLYPEIASRMRAPLATASMSYDHIAIRRFVDELSETDPADLPRLQQLLYGLDAVLRVHVWKENELYLRGLEAEAWPAGL